MSGRSTVSRHSSWRAPVAAAALAHRSIHGATIRAMGSMTSTAARREPLEFGHHRLARDLVQFVQHEACHDRVGRSPQREAADVAPAGLTDDPGLVGPPRFVDGPRVAIQSRHPGPVALECPRGAHDTGAAAEIQHTRRRRVGGPELRTMCRRGDSASARRRGRRPLVFRRRRAPRRARGGLAVRRRPPTARAGRGSLRLDAGPRGAASPRAESHASTRESWTMSSAGTAPVYSGLGRGAWGVGRGAWGVGRGAWEAGYRLLSTVYCPPSVFRLPPLLFGCPSGPIARGCSDTNRARVRAGHGSAFRARGRAGARFSRTEALPMNVVYTHACGPAIRACRKTNRDNVVF